MSLAGARTQTAQSRVELTNHLAITPPTNVFATFTPLRVTITNTTNYKETQELIIKKLQSETHFLISNFDKQDKTHLWQSLKKSVDGIKNNLK